MTAGETLAIVIDRDGITEPLSLAAAPAGWRITSVPLHSKDLSFGDCVTLEALPDALRVLSMQAGGWTTLRSRCPIPKSAALVCEITSLGWLVRWAPSGHLALAVPIELLERAEALLDRCEARSIIAAFERAK
ncbi:hypothetical protein EPN42_03610 [bacterium]|nr:MAG: hypothetical protein EPN42_03610 [bacterium]